MDKNNVWDLVPRPEKEKVLNSKWVFKRKWMENIAKFKARLVILGFQDTKDYDIHETYAPVSRLPVVRMVLAIINK